MNLTVGPLPPSVYWRRRLVVLAGVVLVVILFATMCSGSGKSDAAGQQKTAATTSPSPTSPSPSASGQPPILGGVGTGASASASTTATGTPAAPPPAATPTQSGDCSDAEIKLTASVQKNADGTWYLTLKVRNISSRTCSRDVGGDPQEIHVVQNGQTVWSSDACQRVHGQPDVRSFGPNIETTFTVVWGGTIGPDCGNSTKVSGAFQVVAKLGTKVSDPADYPPAVAK